MAVLKNPRHELFCCEYAKGKPAGEAYIAAGYSRKGAGQSAHTLLKKPEIAARVEEIKSRISDRLTSGWIAERSQRIAALEDMALRMRSVVVERAGSEHYQDAPGGRTGLLVRKLKMIGSGMSAYQVEEFEVDTGLLKEYREYMKQAAIELGQWEEKSDHTLHGPDNGPIQLEESAILARLRELGHGGAGE